MRILYAASEAAPFVKTGGLADVAGSLPVELARQGHDVRVVLPLYSAISDKWRGEMQFLRYTYVFLAWRRQYCGVFELRRQGVVWYFIDNEYYFKRPAVYGHYDDGERFGFFSKAVTQLFSLIDWRPEVIHCNDWQTALVPVYLRREWVFNDIRTVFTIHNIEYQGRFGRETMWELFGLPMELYDGGLIEYDGAVNLMKGAIYTSDAVTAVSPSYAEEILTPEFGCGLHDVLRFNSHKLTGIINGLDTEHYDPSRSPGLAQNYAADDVSPRVYCKLALQRQLRLPEDEGAPVVACISRLVPPKGMDLVLGALPRLMELGAQLVVLGSGDWAIEQRFREAAARWPGRISVNIMYSAPLSAQIYAGADLFLMPSRWEPCGLSQLIAMRFGAVPLVRLTGGLKDTVIPLPAPGANGFGFEEYSAGALTNAIEEAIGLYRDYRSEWDAVQRRGMEADFSWESSAKKYIGVYEKVMEQTI